MAVGSVGMFGPAGGWGLPVTPATLTITVGGVATEPRYVDDFLQPREPLDLTTSVDHAIVDGAPAARFARRLATLIDDCAGLRVGGPSAAADRPSVVSHGRKTSPTVGEAAARWRRIHDGSRIVAPRTAP